MITSRARADVERLAALTGVRVTAEVDCAHPADAVVDLVVVGVVAATQAGSGRHGAAVQQQVVQAGRLGAQDVLGLVDRVGGVRERLDVVGVEDE